MSIFSEDLFMRDDFPKNIEVFKNQITMFSEYLSVADVDYKYNITFLNEYIDDFFAFIGFVKIKKQVYQRIKECFITKKIDENYILTLDNTVRISKDEMIFLDPDIEKVTKDIICVHFIKGLFSDRQLFYKEYKIDEYPNIAESIVADIEDFYNKKEKNDET